MCLEILCLARQPPVGSCKEKLIAQYVRKNAGVSGKLRTSEASFSGDDLKILIADEDRLHQSEIGMSGISSRILHFLQALRSADSDRVFHNRHDRSFEQTPELDNGITSADGAELEPLIGSRGCEWRNDLYTEIGNG